MKKLYPSLLTALLTALPASLAAAPMGYSINSDSSSNQSDSLYRIDLADGSHTRIGPVTSFGEARIDVEGLAYAPDGILWGVDDASMTMFPVNPDTGQVVATEEVPIQGLPSGGGNDFGLSFACDDTLYITSVSRQSLYRLELNGNTQLIGSEGSLGVNIGAIAAWGDPVKIYGLGNGLDVNQNPDSPAIFEIDAATGTAVQLIALNVDPYSEGGLAFDDDGMLWAILDRRDNQGFPAPSQILQIDLGSSTVTEVATTAESGFESLAITVPRGCGTTGGQNADFKVQKQFMDGNTGLDTTLNIRCNGGLPLEQTFTTEPGAGVEVTFTVTNFTDGALDCEIWESTGSDYYASYECFSTGSCAVTASTCVFENTAAGQDNLCVIRNYPETVDVTVNTEWVYENVEQELFDVVTVDLYCRNIIDGDGQWSPGVMHWSWDFDNTTPAQTASIQSRSDASAECRTEQRSPSSAIDSTSNCTAWTTASAGLVCTVTNTYWFEGVPALSRGGLLIASLLLLFTGLLFVRRF
jgi:hypothetical protein